MGHNITGLIIPGPCDAGAAREWDVVPAPLGDRLSLVPVSHYYTAYQQAVRGEVTKLDVPAGYPPTFPREGVVLRLADALTGAGGTSTFALVMTDYFGGVGDQWACVYARGERVPGIRRVNEALRALGVRPAPGLDEFDTVGLGRYRGLPEYLDRYEELCEDLGV